MFVLYFRQKYRHVVSRGKRSICRWTRNEDFQYGISRFWKKYGRQTVFSTLDDAGNCWKK